MKRVIYINNALGNKDKFIFKNEYENFGIYKEMTPSGYFVRQSYLITDEKITVVVYSFNDMCYEEILVMIDSIIESRKQHTRANYKAIWKYDKEIGKHIYILHPNGDDIF